MDDKTRQGPKRLTIDVSEELHYALRNVAAKRGITLRKYVSRCLERAIACEIPKIWETRK